VVLSRRSRAATRCGRRDLGFSSLEIRQLSFVVAMDNAGRAGGAGSKSRIASAIALDGGGTTSPS